MKGEFLGRGYPVAIGGCQGVLKLPSIPEGFAEGGNSSVPLTAPEDRWGLNRDWGTTFQRPSGDAWVKTMAFEVDSSDRADEEIFSQISEGLPKWHSLFLRALAALGFNPNWQYVHQDPENQFAQAVFGYEERPDGSLQDLGRSATPVISVTIPPVVSEALWQEALRRASEESEPKLEYQLLNAAQLHLNQSKFRQALLDAHTAYEIALDAKMRHLLSEKFDGEPLNVLHGSMKQVSVRRKLLTSMDVRLPYTSNEYQSELEEIRNKALHKGEIIGKDAAMRGVKIAGKTIRCLSGPPFD